MSDKHLIWANDPSTLQSLIEDKEWVEFVVKEWKVDPGDSGALWEAAAEQNDYSLDDEHANLNIPCNPVIVYGQLGRWNGHFPAHKFLNVENIGECIDASLDDQVEYYVQDGELQVDTANHDASSHYYIRELKDGISIDKLDELIYNASKQKRDVNALIKRYTKSLAPAISKVYGWKLPRGRKSAAQTAAKQL